MKSFFYKFTEKTTEIKSTITFFDILFGHVRYFLGNNAFTFGFIHYLCEQNIGVNREWKGMEKKLKIGVTEVTGV